MGDVVTHAKAPGGLSGAASRDVLNPQDDKLCSMHQLPISKGMEGLECHEEMLGTARYGSSDSIACIGQQPR